MMIFFYNIEKYIILIMSRPLGKLFNKTSEILKKVNRRRNEFVYVRIMIQSIVVRPLSQIQCDLLINQKCYLADFF